MFFEGEVPWCKIPVLQCERNALCEQWLWLTVIRICHGCRRPSENATRESENSIPWWLCTHAQLHRASTEAVSTDRVITVRYGHNKWMRRGRNQVKTKTTTSNHSRSLFIGKALLSKWQIMVSYVAEETLSSSIWLCSHLSSRRKRSSTCRRTLSCRKEEGERKKSWSLIPNRKQF